MAMSPTDRTVAIRRPPQFLQPANQMLAPARYSAGSAQKRHRHSRDRLVPQADRVSLLLIPPIRAYSRIDKYQIVPLNLVLVPQYHRAVAGDSPRDSAAS